MTSNVNPGTIKKKHWNISCISATSEPIIYSIYIYIYLLFTDSRDIEHISLDANPLVIIKTKAFNDIRDVGVIYMPLRVDTIQADAFHGLENVTELAFDQMKSDAIGQFAFRGLNKVDRIIISNSVVRVFDSGVQTFNHQTSLDHSSYRPIVSHIKTIVAHPTRDIPKEAQIESVKLSFAYHGTYHNYLHLNQVEIGTG